MSRVLSAVFAPTAFFLFSALTVSPEPSGVSPAPNPSLDEIVERVQQRAAAQSKELDSYEATRHYAVQYRGYATTLSAGMAVEVHFDRAAGKTFRIVSQSGSKLLCDKVLKKALESEKEAARDASATALSPANYRFQLTGTDMLNGRPAYVLHVDPLQSGKFLYRGKVWVDTADYAVAKIEVEPAKNPSLWISRSKIENTYAAIDGVWLPQSNRSESRIRVGGTAVLTIDYGTYQVVLAGQHAVAAGHLVSIAPSAQSAKD
jgi:hypothetical protein